MIGNAALLIAFFTALAAGCMFLLPVFGVIKTNRNAVHLYYVHSAAVITASAYLLYALLSHRFQYLYVYAHTERSLDTKYLISAFWAGQEGSYLFWVLCGAIIGLLLLKTEKEVRHIVMPVFLVGQTFLLLFLLLGSPFEMASVVPPDGTGLNPLLLDPWMVIHPPIVFIGYALLIVPFAYVVAAFYRREYQTIFLKGLPWALTGWFFLGAGIFVGGVWAYRVLGWGGYWGWDPVENASLVPWLTGTALIHGMLLQKQKQFYTRFNVFLAITTYLLVISATFLTRSGVMAQYSVHSFAETPLTPYLIAFMICISLPAYTLFVTRYREIGGGESVELSPLNRQGSFGLTMVILCVSALLVLLGTLSPLLTGAFGTASSVGESYYFLTNAPLALILLVLLGLCPFLRLQKKEPIELIKTLILPIASMPVALTIGLFSGVSSLFDLLFLAAGSFALIASIVILYKVLIRQGIKNCGGYLSHVGLALMLIGILASTNYTRSQLVQLVEGVTATALDHSLTYQGHAIDGEKFALNISVDDGEKNSLASPKMYLAGNQLMREPAILRTLWRDLYISPSELKYNEPDNVKVLSKGEEIEFEDYKIKFTEFILQPHGNTDTVEVGTALEVSTKGKTETLIPTLKFEGNEFTATAVHLPESDVEVILDGVDASEGRARFLIGEQINPGHEVLVAEIKIKPLISVLALGTALLIVGSLIAVWRRVTVG